MFFAPAGTLDVFQQHTGAGIKRVAWWAARLVTKHAATILLYESELSYESEQSSN